MIPVLKITLHLPPPPLLMSILLIICDEDMICSGPNWAFSESPSRLSCHSARLHGSCYCTCKMIIQDTNHLNVFQIE